MGPLRGGHVIMDKGNGTIGFKLHLNGDEYAFIIIIMKRIDTNNN